MPFMRFCAAERTLAARNPPRMRTACDAGRSLACQRPRLSSCQRRGAILPSISSHLSHHRCPLQRMPIRPTVRVQVGRPRNEERIATFTKPEDDPEEFMRNIPRATDYQQTLMKSFTLGGIGLHTGEYGTNEERFKLDDGSAELPDVDEDEEPAEEIETLKMELFKEFLIAEEGGYTGTFEQWIEAVRDEKIEGAGDKAAETDEAEDEDDAAAGETAADAAAETTAATAADDAGDADGEAGEADEDEDEQGDEDEDEQKDEDEEQEDEEEDEDRMEEPQARSAQDSYVLATLDNAVPGPCGMYTALQSGGMQVKSVEALLSALEACGVENARIEIEGGDEVPVLDGASLGWVIFIQQAGLRPAPSMDGSVTEVRKRALMLSQPVAVYEGDAFVSAVPARAFRVTYGLDLSNECPVIGRQFVTWCLDDFEHYRFSVAPARPFITSLEEGYAMRSKGLLKAGTENCLIIGFGDRWYDPQLVRFHEDEPARHMLSDLVGDLALLGQEGNAGLPMAHVVAFNADHELHLKFIKALRDASTDDDYVNLKLVPVEFVEPNSSRNAPDDEPQEPAPRRGRPPARPARKEPAAIKDVDEMEADDEGDVGEDEMEDEELDKAEGVRTEDLKGAKLRGAQ